jgi:hypothetical protein
MVNSKGLSMFHEFSSDGFDLPHLDVMVNISHFQLFLLDKAVEIGASSIHLNKIIYTNIHSKI